ncbi:MAG TPA: hypothetical protein VLV25_01980 [Steroidobacteraceae bacterium]|nr:hypothetical protein [Steroidobacteraceae bacterium]
MNLPLEAATDAIGDELRREESHIARCPRIPPHTGVTNTLAERELVREASVALAEYYEAEGKVAGVGI